jgi:predicted dehydrogenase
VDPQEDQLKAGMGFDAPGFGEEPETAWGELKICDGGNPETRRVKTERGDYRGFYENVRDALLGKAELEVKPEQVWRTTRLIELARESSGQGRRVKVEFGGQP